MKALGDHAKLCLEFRKFKAAKDSGKIHKMETWGKHLGRPIATLL